MARGRPGVLQLPLARDTAYCPPPSLHADADDLLDRLLCAVWGHAAQSLPPKSFRFGGVQGWGPKFHINPTLAPRLALALPGCRSIGPVHPVSPLQKLMVPQSRPVRGELSDRSEAHGGKDGLMGFVVNSDAGEQLGFDG